MNLIPFHLLEMVYAISTGLVMLLLIMSASFSFLVKNREEAGMTLAKTAMCLTMLNALLQLALLWRHDSPGVASVQGWLRAEAASAMMLLLIGLLGWVILRYSYQYLEGESGRPRYSGWLSLTLASVCLMVAANNLLLISICWSVASLVLHQLLTFYPHRYAAQLAAHKKFILSRLADVMTLAACVLLVSNLGTLQLDQMYRLLEAPVTHGVGLAAAATLFALSAILKCAQIPFHGWLLQVMEAPTPVSALLHAGVVNIGGFVLISLAPLMEQSMLASGLLVVFGGLTTLVASLVMMTRVSIKLSLAWSTVAQMGFMLLEIGLGAYSLALLHIVGHSLYKAYAFLSAGDTVFRFRIDSLAGKGSQTFSAALLILLLVAALAALAVVLSEISVAGGEGLAWVLAINLIMGWVALTIIPLRLTGLLHRFSLQLLAIAAIFLYIGWHQVFYWLYPLHAAAPELWKLVFSGSCLLILIGLQSHILCFSKSRLSIWLHPRAFAGFYLDELFTRMTLLIWPVKLARAESSANNAQKEGDVS